MRILGIDYGTKRIGISLSDEACQFALPHSVIKNYKDPEILVHDIGDIALKNGIKEIVLGESRNYKGEANAIFADSLEFKKALEQKGFIVHFEPEFMTSANAERFQGKNELHDASAAALILQSFLDKRRSASGILH